VLVYVLQALVKSIAPVMCHAAEETFAFTPGPIKKTFFRSLAKNESWISSAELDSIFASGWMEFPDAWIQPDLKSRWDIIRKLKNRVNKSVEVARNSTSQFSISSAMEVDVVLKVESGSSIDKSLRLVGGVESVKDLFIISDLKIELIQKVDKDKAFVSANEPSIVSVSANDTHVSWLFTETDADHVESKVFLQVRQTSGVKCPRCWKYHQQTSASGKENVCRRCLEVLKTL
jgi:isoleucyl-tRNA synthetase